ncbi:hypothetical protein [Xenorhabdus bovienii]
MSKKWVFEALVKDDKDAVGLMAYALYKYKNISWQLILEIKEKAKI